MFIKKELPIDEPPLVEANGKDTDAYHAVNYQKLDNETLIIDIYKDVGNKVSRFIPVYRIYQRENEYLSYIFEEKKWSSSSIQRLLYISYNTEEFNSDIAKEFTEKWNYTGCDKQLFNILHLQDKLLEIRRTKKYANERKRIDMAMLQFKKGITKRQEKFLKKDIFRTENFIFYDKKQGKGFCTHCEKDVLLKGMTYRHNQKGKCPVCHNAITYKASGISHKYLTTSGTGVIFEKRDKKLLARYFDVQKNYGKNFKEPDITIYEVVRSVFDKNEIRNYERRQFHNLGINWCKCNPHISYTSYAGYNYDVRYLANVNYGFYGLKNAIKDTYCQYSEVETWLKKYNSNAWSAETYMKDYYKFPVMESLLKLGMYDLTKRLRALRFRECNLEEKELHKILCLTKEQFKLLNSINNPQSDLYECMRANKTNLNFSIEQYEYVNKILKSSYRLNEMFELFEMSSFHKISRYLEKKERNPIIYLDYIKFCKKLGWNLKNSFVLFPKKLEEAHDEASALLKESEKKAEIDAINKRLPEIAKKYNFTYKDLIIIAPQNAKEYISESQALHNCISRNYMDTMAQGKCSIVFIRRASEPNKPYFAMEIGNDNRIIQVRGMKNCGANKEVKECVEAFKKKIA